MDQGALRYLNLGFKPMPEQPPKFICEICNGAHPTSEHKKTDTDQAEQEAAKAEMLRYLEIGKPDIALKIIKESNLSEKVVASQEALVIIKAKLIETFSEGFPWVAEEYTDHLPIPKEIVLKSLKEGLIIALSDGRFDAALRTKNEFPVPDEIIQSKEIKEAIKKGIPKMRVEGYSEKRIQQTLEELQLK